MLPNTNNSVKQFQKFNYTRIKCSLNKDGDGSWNVVYNKRYIETETFKLEMQRKKPCFLPAAEGDSLAILSAYVLNLVGKSI